MPYSLRVQIAEEDLRVIKEGQYNLCLTKGVKYHGKDRPGNVVFSTVMTQDMAPYLEFSWDEKYQVYMSQSFQTGAPVRLGTDTYDISPGMGADFDDNGNAKTTGSPDMSRPIVVDNNWRDAARVGIANYNEYTQKFATTYISLPTLITTTNNLIPTQKVGLFFHGQYVTDTIIDVSETKTFPVDLTDRPRTTVRFENGRWRIL